MNFTVKVKCLLFILAITVLNTYVKADLKTSSFATGKEIVIIVPFGKGGASDIIANIIAAPLAKELNTTISIEYITGLGGSIGLSKLKKSPKDGLTLAIGASSNYAAYPAFNPNKVDYDPLQDFIYITKIIDTPHILAVSNKIKATNFKEFINHANTVPVPYSYASSGTGGSPHLLMEAIKGRAKLKLAHLPLHKGSGSAIKAVLVGRSQVILDVPPSLMPHLVEGKMHALAVLSAQRMPSLSNIPTLEELGFGDLNLPSSFGLLAPKGIPASVVAQLNGAMVKVLNSKEVQDKFMYSLIGADSVAKFTGQVVDENNTYKKIVAKYNLSLD